MTIDNTITDQLTLDDARVLELRADTPGAELVTHFNNAGSALPPRVVLDTTVDYLRREAEIGGYELAAESDDAIASVYDSVARLIGARADQIALVENATRAWDMAVYGYPFQAGDRVLTARAEYASNAIALLQLQRRHGIEIVLIDDDEHGQISLDHLDAELARGAAMVSLTHIPTNGGLVNPAAAVGAACRSHDVFYVLDACQSAGHVPLDVAEIGCDVLSSTGRKYLRGPRGTGFLYVGERALEIIEPPFLDLLAATWTSPDSYEIRGDARRFENWETNYATRVGLGAAVDYALTVGVEAGWERIRHLADRLRSALAEVDGVAVHDKGEVRSGICTFTHRTVPAADIASALRSADVNVSVSSPQSAQYDLPARGLPTLVRASVHYYNTEREIDVFIGALEAAIAACQA